MVNIVPFSLLYKNITCSYSFRKQVFFCDHTFPYRHIQKIFLPLVLRYYYYSRVTKMTKVSSLLTELSYLDLSHSLECVYKQKIFQSKWTQNVSL